MVVWQKACKCLNPVSGLIVRITGPWVLSSLFFDTCGIVWFANAYFFHVGSRRCAERYVWCWSEMTDAWTCTNLPPMNQRRLWFWMKMSMVPKKVSRKALHLSTMCVWPTMFRDMSWFDTMSRRIYDSVLVLTWFFNHHLARERSSCIYPSDPGIWTGCDATRCVDFPFSSAAPALTSYSFRTAYRGWN